MWLCAPEYEQRLYKKNVLKQNYFPPVYCTLRACGKFLILNALCDDETTRQDET
jgi:hypothetical protein